MYLAYSADAFNRVSGEETCLSCLFPELQSESKFMDDMTELGLQRTGRSNGVDLFQTKVAENGLEQRSGPFSNQGCRERAGATEWTS